MINTFTAMSVVAVVSILVMGVEALWHILAAIIPTLIIYYVISFYQKSRGKPLTYQKPFSPLVAAMVLALSVSASAPYVLTATMAMIAILAFKYGQGRLFGRKYVNPAAATKVILLMLLSVMELELGMIFHPHHLRLNLLTASGFSRAVSFFRNDNLTPFQSLILWKDHGWIGGGSGIIVLIVGAVMTYWLRLKWRIPLSMLVTTGVLALSAAFLTGGDPLLRIAFHVFIGSVIFQTFFMATEPQTTPISEKSQYVFGVLLALLTFILESLDVLGGSIIALVGLNLVTPFLDRIGLKRSYGH